MPHNRTSHFEPTRDPGHRTDPRSARPRRTTLRCRNYRAEVERLEPRQLLAAVRFSPVIIDQPDAGGPSAVYTSDLDGDGDHDVLVAGYKNDTVSWYANDGQGNFGLQQLISDTVEEARDVLPADLDGDGDMDVVAAAYRGDEFVWFENTDGRGKFGPQRTIDIDRNGPWTIFAADLDADGDLDVITGSWFDDMVAWHENMDGKGTFGPRRVLSQQTDGPRDIAAADIDGDSDIDVVVASRLDDKISLWKNEGGGTFGLQQIVPLIVSGPEAVRLADLDGDGDLDIAAASYWTATINWSENGDGKGGFLPGRVISGPDPENRGQDVTVADLDGDGDLDVVSASYYQYNNSVVWYENDGRGSFGPEKFVTFDAAGVDSVVAADLDGDGDLDVVTGSVIDDKLAWHVNSGKGVFLSSNLVTSDAAGAASVAAADLNGDGLLDIIAASYWDNKVAWYPQQSPGQFGPQQVISTSALRAQSVMAADFDGDGDMDVLSASYADDTIAWYSNSDGRGQFGPAQIITNQANGAVGIAVADLDGDGDTDVLSASAVDGRVAWYPNTDGQGAFGAAVFLSRRSPGAESVTAADLDADGDQDVVVASYGDGRVAWYENTDGRGNFTASRTLGSASGASSVVTLDVDGDGDLDIAAALYGDNSVIWFENTDGRAGFSPPLTITNVLSRVDNLATGDLDGNGLEDVVAGAIGSGVITWYEKDPAGFQEHNVSAGIDGPVGVATADVDGDGDVDVLSASFFNSRIIWLRNESESAREGDFDGDADVDADDIDRLCAEVRRGTHSTEFDLTNDQIVDGLDLDRLVRDILKTAYGDANLDGVFNSGDLVRVFQVGEYEDGIPENSGWSEGDWNCDAEFDTKDFVVAFQGGGYVFT